MIFNPLKRKESLNSFSGQSSEASSDPSVVISTLKRMFGLGDAKAVPSSKESRTSLLSALEQFIKRLSPKG